MEQKNKKDSIKIVPPGKKKCVWMEAGVVSYKLCDNNYDCPTCAYDQAMQRKVEKQRAVAPPPDLERQAGKITETWVARMMRLPASQRKCRYMLTGEVNRKICPSAYECGTCSFDKMMQSRLQTESLPASLRVHTGGVVMAADTYYHRGHVWAKPEYGGRVRVGVDDFARALVGNISGLKMPEIGSQVAQGRPAFTLRKNGFSVQLVSPVNGVVCRINEKLFEDPSVLSKSPYERGWLAIIEPERLKKDLKALLFGEDAEQYFSEQAQRLISELQQDQRLAADGGQLLDDILANVDQGMRERLINIFLKP